jgi:hypothetical protein
MYKVVILDIKRKQNNFFGIFEILASSRDFNKLVIKAKMHVKTFFLLLLFENTIWFIIFLFLFFRETWPYAWKQNIFYILTKKKDILILDLYLYSIKIQTNIDQNVVKYLQKITDFLK